MDNKLKNITKEEWRQLGYYYEIDEINKKWIIVGSLFGIRNFISQLNEYANNSKNSKISEHDHWGPYMYLKIMTNTDPVINKNCISGSLSDLKRLSEIIDKKLNDNLINTTLEIKEEYSKDCEYSIQFKIMEYGFDPATEDKQLWDIKS